MAKRKNKQNRGLMRALANVKIKSTDLNLTKINPLALNEHVKISAKHDLYPGAAAIIAELGVNFSVVVLPRKGRLRLKIDNDMLNRTIAWDANALLIEQRTASAEPKRTFFFDGGVLSYV